MPRMPEPVVLLLWAFLFSLAVTNSPYGFCRHFNKIVRDDVDNKMCLRMVACHVFHWTFEYWPSSTALVTLSLACIFSLSLCFVLFLIHIAHNSTPTLQCDFKLFSTQLQNNSAPSQTHCPWQVHSALPMLITIFLDLLLAYPFSWSVDLAFYFWSFCHDGEWGRFSSSPLRHCGQSQSLYGKMTGRTINVTLELPLCIL